MVKKFLFFMALFLIVTVAILVDFGVAEHSISHAQLTGALVGIVVVSVKELNTLWKIGKFDIYDAIFDVAGIVLPVLFAFGLQNRRYETNKDW